MNTRSARQGKSEKLTASSTANFLTVLKIKPTPETSTGAANAFITVEDAIRYTVDGTAPVASTKIGHVHFAGSPLQLEGEQNLLNFRFVRESATTDTTIFVTYF